MKRSSLLWVAATVVACSGGFGVTGDLQAPIPVTLTSNVLLVPADVGGGAHSVVVDTGSPLTLLDPAAFGGGQVSPGRNVVDLTLGGAVTFTNLPVEGVTLCGAGCAFGGLFGGDVMSRYAVSLDYRNQLFAFGSLPGDGNTTEVPALVEGGGRGQILGTNDVVAIGPTRVEVPVTVEGTPHAFVVDTGASFVTVRSTLFDALVADGRGQLSASLVTLGSGQTGQVTRVRELDVGAASVTTFPALTIGDTLLDALSAEVGHPIDGLLGGTFLRQFLVTVDYPGGRLVLDRYASEDHVHDEFERVGMLLQADAGGQYSTGTVFPGSDVATNQAIPPCFMGGTVKTIAGQPVTGLSADAADTLLRGTVGTTKTVQVVSTCDGTTLLSFTFKVEELLPLP